MNEIWKRLAYGPRLAPTSAKAVRVSTFIDAMRGYEPTSTVTLMESRSRRSLVAIRYDNGSETVMKVRFRYP